MTQGPFKTLHCTNAWHETSGGIATFYRAMIRAANLAGHELRLIVPGPEDRIEQTGPTTRIYHIAAPASPLNSGYRTVYPSHFLWPQSRIQRILAEERPDVIEICDKYTFNYLGATLRHQLLPQLNLRPLVLGLSCERMDENVAAYLSHGWFARRLSAFYMRWLYFPFFDHHLVNSHHTAEELRLASHGHPVRRGTWVMPMGVDFAGFSPDLRTPAARAAIAATANVDPASTLLLYAGRLVPEKNLGLLLDTLESLVNSQDGRNYTLLIAGEGIAQPGLEQQANLRLPGRVRFLGHLHDRRQLAALYANADVFLHPNPREPFGIGPLEAMASGLPLVAPNAGGVLTYASPFNAWLAAPDATSFTAAIHQLLSSPSDRTVRVQQARITASHYTWDEVAASFLELYATLHAARTASDPASQPTAAFAPLFWSTPPAPTSNIAIAAAAASTKLIFRTVDKLRGISKPTEILPKPGAPAEA